AFGPLIKVRRAAAAHSGKRVIIVGIGGGLRQRESLGMAEGATMPNLFGTQPLIAGFGTSAGAPRIAPEYAASRPALVLPPARATPLFTQGTVITNLRYADGPPGHLQGHGCLLSGYYNKLENPAYGSRYAGVYLQPPGVMQPVAELVVSGKRSLELTPGVVLPTIPYDPA